MGEEVKRKNRKRKKKLIRRIRTIVLVLLAVLGGHFMARINLEVNAVLDERMVGTDISSVEVDESTLGSDDRIVNILLMGSDKRVEWKETGRSDSVMIATMDLKNKRLKITSLMRDMYVPIPDHGENRFNAAYSFGGVGLVYKTIAANFGVRLDGYVVVDFAAFEAVINTIGGVEITLTDAEHKYLTTAYKKGSVKKLTQGLNNMNGKQALAYTRIRQDAKGDFGRTERQRKVLEAIFKKAKSMPATKLVELAKNTMHSVSTDLTNEEIISYLESVIWMGTTEIDQMRIPIDDSYYQDRINKMAVLVPDIEANKEALHEFIFEYAGE